MQKVKPARNCEHIVPENATSPFLPLFHQEIEAAHSIEELRELSVRILDVAKSAIRPDADIKRMVKLASRFNDAVTLRLISLLDSVEGIRLPGGAAYLALGSEGRSEQALRADQDSAIVFNDDLPQKKLRDIELFATRLVDALEEIGVPRCPGNIMARNPQWRHSLTEWRRLLDQWITVPTPEHMLNFGILHGLRALHGDKTLEAQLHDHIRTAVRSPTLFFPHMARHALRFPPPLTILGRIRVEHSGEHRGKVDLKKAGIFAVTVGASLLALENGSIGGSTWEKLELIGKQGILAPCDVEAIEKAFTFLVRLRLQWQLREMAAHGKLTNHVDPRAMTERERHELRQAIKGVDPFRRFISNRYQLNFISR